MNTKHTPGPWEAVEVGMSNAGPNGIPVYEVMGGYGTVRVAEHLYEGDARLCAAAPELLEALRDFLLAASPGAKAAQWRALSAQATRKARAAIARATGGQT
jgi:hypothetical protein